MADIFIGWSGGRSQTIATNLKVLLEDLFLGRETWMSEDDIQAGTRWNEELSGHLESARFGIVCLTPENLDAEWIIFEAGALSKSVEEGRVVPYRFQLKPSDVGPPLSQFQGVNSDKEGTLKLVKSINKVLGGPLPTERLPKLFGRAWPDLQKELVSIPKIMPTPDIRTDRDILEEILLIIRPKGILEQKPSKYFHPLDEKRQRDWRYVWSAIVERHGKIEEMDLTSLRHFIDEVSSFSQFYIGWHTPHDFDDFVEDKLINARARLAELEESGRAQA
jgi:hypothetical protein